MEFNAYSALGLTAPEETGGTEQEVAEPATGETEQEVAEPAEVEDDAAEEAAEDTAEEAEPEEEPESTAEEKKEQSKTDRAENARRRRQRETEEAVRKAVEKRENELRAQYDKIIEAAGLENPYDGKKPVTKIEELEAYTRTRGQKRLEKELREGRLTQEGLATAIESSESIQAIRKLTAEKEAVESERREQKIAGQLEEIGKLDPTIKTVADLLTMKRAKEFRGYVDRGLTFVEAYKLANLDKLQSSAVNMAKREAMNSADGRKHLKTTQQRGAALQKSVPTDVMELYRALNPGATDAEIQSHYNRHMKER